MEDVLHLLLLHLLRRIFPAAANLREFDASLQHPNPVLEVLDRLQQTQPGSQARLFERPRGRAPKHAFNCRHILMKAGQSHVVVIFLLQCSLQNQQEQVIQHTYLPMGTGMEECELPLTNYWQHRHCLRLSVFQIDPTGTGCWKEAWTAMLVK